MDKEQITDNDDWPEGEEWIQPPEEKPRALDFEDTGREFEDHTFEDDFDEELGDLDEKEEEELSDEDLEVLHQELE